MTNSTERVSMQDNEHSLKSINKHSLTNQNQIKNIKKETIENDCKY